MRKAASISLAAFLALGGAGSASAQASAPGGAEHDAHHPGAVQPAPAPCHATPRMGSPGGMMDGGDMGRMMQMMQERRAAAAMRPFRRIEGQLAYFRTELRITDAQAPQWNAFADAVRAGAVRLRGATAAAMASGPGPVPAPQQMERRIDLVSAQLEAMRGVAAAVGPLYAALSEEQRRTSDELMAEHFRTMRMGTP